MKLLVDAQLPPQLAEWLRNKGHDASAAPDIGLRDASGAQIWTFATQEAAVIRTKDEDFAEMAARLIHGPSVFWIRCGNVLNRELFKRFEEPWPIAETRLEDGARLVDLRKTPLLRLRFIPLAA